MVSIFIRIRMSMGSKEDINKQIDYQSVKVKIANYCVYRERSTQEVYDKILSSGIAGSEATKMLAELKEENFVDEERFARLYARGKFQQNKWGKFKIRIGLQAKGVAAETIESGLSEIDDETYHTVLEKLLEQKTNREKEKDIYKLKEKVARFLIGKGFEPALVWHKVNELIK